MCHSLSKMLPVHQQSSNNLMSLNVIFYTLPERQMLLEPQVIYLLKQKNASLSLLLQDKTQFSLPHFSSPCVSFMTHVGHV